MDHDDHQPSPEVMKALPVDPPDAAPFCPRCRYPLVGVREAGLECCPSCGLRFDLDQLQHTTERGIDLSGHSCWGLSLRMLRARFPRDRGSLHLWCFRELPRLTEGFVATILGLVAPSLGLSVLASFYKHWVTATILSAPIAAAVVAHVATFLWVRSMLRAVEGMVQADRASWNVMHVMATQYLPIAANQVLWTLGWAALWSAGLLHERGARSDLGAYIFLIALALILIAVVAHVVLWLNASLIVRQMLRSEVQQYRSRNLRHYISGRWPPILPIVIGGPVFMFLAVLLLIDIC